MQTRQSLGDANVYQSSALPRAVLTKIVRQQKMSLSLIEQSSAWAAYLVNTACVVYVKHTTQGRTAKDGGKVYRFTFAPEHVSELAKFEDDMPHCKVMVALVCATAEIAFFPVGQLWQCIDRDDRDANQGYPTAYPAQRSGAACWINSQLEDRR